MTKIIRSHRRTLSIEITSCGDVLVRAPFWTSASDIDRILIEKKTWIERKQKERLQTPKPSCVTLHEMESMRRRAKEMIPERVLYWSSKTGLCYSSVRITSAQKRFGSCSAKNALSFSLFLVSFPLDLIDYVVVHELCHTVEHNHSASFYRLLSGILPDWKERQERLRMIPIPELKAKNT